MLRFIEVRHRFEGFHKWSMAPDEVKFLRDLHRHEFHVRLRMQVSHNDRELEFILVKRWLATYLAVQSLNEIGSCEMLAERIITFAHKEYGFRSIECEVSEDGENGAVLVIE